MALTVTVLNGGGTASATVDITNRVRADKGLQLGNRAFQGESSQSVMYVDDDDGEYGNPEDLPGGLTQLSIAAHNVVTVTETATTPDTVLLRGRVIPKEIGRGDLYQDRGRQVVVRMDDYNADLKGLTLLADVSRSAETDVARVTWVFDTYLSGSPRLTTDLTSGIVAGNTTTMPAKTYEAGTTILDILNDCAVAAEKTFFVMADGTFYYAPHSDMSKTAGLRISDRDDEIDLEGGSGTPTVSAAEGEGNNDETMPTVTVASGSGALIAVCVTAEDQATPTVTWKPNSLSGATDQLMTIIGSVAHATPSSGTSKDGEKLWIAWLANPNASTANAPGILWDDVGGNVGSLFGYWTVDSSATPTVYTNSGTGTTSTVTPTADAADLVLDCAGYRFWSLGNDSNTPNATASQTENWTVAFNNSAGQNDGAWGGGSSTGSGARTWDLVKNTNWVAAAIVIPGEVATYPPIWTGPASTEDGQGLLSGAVLRYGGGKFVTETRADVVDEYDYWVEPIHDAGAVDAADAAARLTAILDIREFEKRTYQVGVQLHRSKVDLLMAGQMISIKARATSDADDQYRTRRIASLEWQWIGPEHWLAVMELDRPLDMRGAGASGGSGSGQAALANRPKNASQTSYDNTSSGLTGDTVQEAIDEIAAGAITQAVVDHGAMGATETFDFTAGKDHEGTIDTNLTVTLTGATDGEAAWMTLKLTDSGGPHTITWPASVVWPGDEPPDAPDAGETLVVTLFSYDATTWYGSYPGGGRASGHWETIVSGSAPPVAVTNEAADDWLVGWVDG